MRNAKYVKETTFLKKEKVVVILSMEKKEFLPVKQLRGKQHFNVARIYESKKVLDGTVIMEEYVEGKNLDDIIRKSGEEFSLEEIIEIGIQLCDGLRFLHRQKYPILHGDIKPENIILVGRNPIHIKLIDLHDCLCKRDDVLLKSFRGTRGFCAPEQEEGRYVDFCSDIYGIGKTLEFLQYGVKEGKGKKRLLKIIKKATAINPKDRFVTVAELQNELSAILYGY
ncbi:MAG: protein kinase [Lachnospiraceae bacterium]|nr:protein kinase [Lachnospiraceae bacterium]